VPEHQLRRLLLVAVFCRRVDMTAGVAPGQQVDAVIDFFELELQALQDGRLGRGIGGWRFH
jgi:hypothetical protein